MKTAQLLFLTRSPSALFSEKSALCPLLGNETIQFQTMSRALDAAETGIT